MYYSCARVAVFRLLLLCKWKRLRCVNPLLLECPFSVRFSDVCIKWAEPSVEMWVLAVMVLLSTSFCLSDGCEGQSLLAVSQSGLSLSLASLFSGICRRDSSGNLRGAPLRGSWWLSAKLKKLLFYYVYPLKKAPSFSEMNQVFLLFPQKSSHFLGFVEWEQRLILFYSLVKSFSVYRQTSCLLKRVELCAWLFVMPLVAQLPQGFGDAGGCFWSS